MRWMLSSEQENRKKSLKVGPPGIDVFCAMACIAMSTKRMAWFKFHCNCMLLALFSTRVEVEGEGDETFAVNMVF